MTSTSPKVKVRLGSGRALVCYVDAVRCTPLADSLDDLIPMLESGQGLRITYPNGTYIPNRSIEYIEAADPAEPLGWSQPYAPDDGTAMPVTVARSADPLGLTADQRHESDLQEFVSSLARPVVSEPVGGTRRRIDVDGAGRRRPPLPYNFTGDVMSSD